MANEYVYTQQSTNNNAFKQWHGGATGESGGTFGLGESDVEAPNTYYDGACRFPGLAIAQGVTVYSAQLKIYSQFEAGSTIRFNAYGIKEVNTAEFSSNPFGRTKTTAVTGGSSGPPGVGNYINIDVTSQVNEILAQGSWASGNAIGFMVFDNTSNNTSYIQDDSESCLLVIKLSVDPDFFPDPGSIAAPTFPETTHIGIRISQPNVDVKTALSSQLLFSTRQKEYKTITRAGVDCTMNVEKIIAHGLSYSPAFIAYVESGGYRFKLNRDFLGATDPVSGGAQGYIGSDDTNLRILIDKSKNVYYYVFIDELEE